MVTEFEELDLTDEERADLYEGLTGNVSPDRYSEEIENYEEAEAEHESWMRQVEEEASVWAEEMGGESFPLTDIEKFLRAREGWFYYVNYYQHAIVTTAAD